MPEIDPEQLRHAVEARRSARPAQLPGRRVTGAMAVVRAHLDTLRTLHAEGFTWVELAAALTTLGVTQGDGRPLLARRLTGLIDSVERQTRRRRKREEARRARSDLARPDAGSATRLRLSADLASSGTPSDRAIDPSADEAEIRRQNLRKLQDLLKPASPPHSGKD